MGLSGVDVDFHAPVHDAVSFMTNNALIRPGNDLLRLQRTNIEAHFPPAVARIGLSGFFDVTDGPKRWRVNRLTAAAG